MDYSQSGSSSMELSRQEHWSGLPCPPPRDLPNPRIEPTSLPSPARADRFFFFLPLAPPEKPHPTACVSAAQLCQVLCNFMDWGLPGSSVHGISRQEYSSGLPFPFPGDSPDPGIEHRSPALQADSLSSEPPGKALQLLQFSSVTQSCPTCCCC